jgi:UDP-N-acetylglucosamine 2-epimerase (non-hydrolysing)
MHEGSLDKRVALVVIGTRPELIKLAPVIWELERDPDWLCCVAFTGQHAELVDDLAPFLRVSPHVQLDVMRPGQPLAALHARLLSELDPIVEALRPDVVVAQGDTTSVLAAATCAFYRGTPFAHVEAGLRTASIDSPFPEEMNRRSVAPLASFHFAPTDLAEQRLIAEGVSPARVYQVGNTVIDTLLDTAARVHSPPSGDAIRVLVTVHRRENHGEPLRRIVSAVREVALARPDVRFLWPVHPNPAVGPVVHEALAHVDNVELREPLAYAELVAELRRAAVVLTDSGGLQEEAPALSVPVLVARADTERPEGVEAGCARLVGTSTEGVVNALTSVLATEGGGFTTGVSPYGDGRAAARIVRSLREHVAVPRRDEEKTTCSESAHEEARPAAGAR